MGGDQNGQAQVQPRPSLKGWTSWHFEKVKKVRCAPSSTPPLWEPADGDHRSWTRIGTPFCQAIYKGVAGTAWENLYYKFGEMNKEVNVCRPSGSSRTTKTETPHERLWSCCARSSSPPTSPWRASTRRSTTVPCSPTFSIFSVFQRCTSCIPR